MKRKRETTFKDIPQDILHLISKYGPSYFDPKKDIGPLEPEQIDIRYDLKGAANREYGGLSQAFLRDNNNILRASEQGPETLRSYTQANKREVLARLERLSREQKMVQAIYGERRANEVRDRKDREEYEKTIIGLV